MSKSGYRLPHRRALTSTTQDSPGQPQSGAARESSILADFVGQDPFRRSPPPVKPVGATLQNACRRQHVRPYPDVKELSLVRVSTRSDPPHEPHHGVSAHLANGSSPPSSKPWVPKWAEVTLGRRAGESSRPVAIFKRSSTSSCSHFTRYPPPPPPPSSWPWGVLGPSSRMMSRGFSSGLG